MNKSEFRVFFSRGKQTMFLITAKTKLLMRWKEFASKLKISEGTLKSYRNEYCSTPYRIFKKICEKCKWDPKKVLSGYKASVRPTVGNARKKLSTKAIEDNGTVELQIQKSILEMKDKNCKSLPNAISEELAEETGIHIGDGFMSKKRYNFRVKGDRKKERSYYDNYLTRLYSKLYGIKIKNKDYGTCYGFEISSKKLWIFKTEIMHIPPEKKDNIRIPKIIRESGYVNMCAFLRGLMDTDGSFEFRSRYGKEGYYPVISLSCKSDSLAQDVFMSFSKLGFSPRKYKDKRNINNIYLYGYSNFERYEEIISWSNPKNKKKVNAFHMKWKGICSLSRNGF